MPAIAPGHALFGGETRGQAYALWRLATRPTPARASAGELPLGDGQPSPAGSPGRNSCNLTGTGGPTDLLAGTKASAGLPGARRRSAQRRAMHLARSMPGWNGSPPARP